MVTHSIKLLNTRACSPQVEIPNSVCWRMTTLAVGDIYALSAWLPLCEATFDRKHLLTSLSCCASYFVVNCQLYLRVYCTLSDGKQQARFPLRVQLRETCNIADLVKRPM